MRAASGCAAELGRDLRGVLFGDAREGERLLKQTAMTQPALFVIEYALARLWMRWGIAPAAMIGHSVGEYVAACLAGVFSLDDALALVAARGRLMQALPAGAMLAVPLSEAELQPWLSDSVSLAAVNAPALSVVSGPTDAIADVEARLAAGGVMCRRLETSHAFHSAMMDPMLGAFRAAVDGRAPAAPRVPFVSNVTGTWITADEATSPDYWAQHLRQPVRFAAGIEALEQAGERVWLEVGPGRTLASLVRQTGGSARTVVTSLRHPQESGSDQGQLLTALGRLWVSGVSVDWAGFSAGEQRRRIPLPTYPFERRRYWLEMQPGRAPADPASQRRLVKAADPASWFYTPSWTRTDLPRAQARAAGSGAWLVFADEAGLGSGLVDRLRGGDDAVVCVRSADRFVASGDDTYGLNPADAAGYDALLDRLDERGKLPDRIIHLWSVGRGAGSTPAAEAFARAQDRGFFSLLYLVQALERRSQVKPVELIVVGDQWHSVYPSDAVAPEKSPALGLCHVISQEYPHIRCGGVEVADVRPGRITALIEQVHAEAAAGPDGIPVAYRGGQRFVEAWAPSPLGPAEDAVWLRDEGVYLITGGLGSIGLAIADRLARAVRARLVLVGRSALPREAWQAWLDTHDATDGRSRQIAALQALEAHGAEVLVASADVANREQMDAVIAQARARFGAVHGVIHAAGAVRGASIGLIPGLRREDCELQFRPKALGLYVIDAVTRDLPLDFCLVTSSLSSLLGGLGYGAYAAANRFLDAFVEQRSRAGGVRWVSANLDAFAFDEGGGRTALSDLNMTPAEGIESLARIMSATFVNRAAVSTGDLETRLARYAKLAAVAPSAGVAGAGGAGTNEGSHAVAGGYERPNLSTPYAPPTNDLETVICDIWRELLAIDKIGVNDDFFELGGHSLLATQLTSRVRRALQVDLALIDLFEAPTVAGLCESILARLLDEEPTVAGSGAESG